MKKKILLVIVLFASVLLISGCTNNGERRIKINKKMLPDTEVGAGKLNQKKFFKKISKNT